MSKAFTRESEHSPEIAVLRRIPEALPPGVKNYMTADGAERLRAELRRLTEVERPRVAALPENLRGVGELQALDQRIAYIHQSLESAVVVEGPKDAGAVDRNEVRFGATVRVKNREGAEVEYRIVGIDEIDIDRGWVSWRSPIAKALMNARAGQKVRLRLPGGEEQLEILEVSYAGH